ncbi:aromatic-ring hydroxylase C-terminal domain-containing protein [Streptomyces prasinus]
MFSDLMDLDDAHRYVTDPLASMDARYDLGDDHRLVGTLCPDMKLTLERPDPDVVTAVTRSADLLREGRGPLLDLVDRAEARDAAAAWTGRVNTVTGPHGPGGRRRVAHPARRLCRLGLAYRAGPRRRPAGACAGHMVRPTGLSTVFNSRLRFAQ